MWLAIHLPQLPLQAVSGVIGQSAPLLIFERIGQRDVVVACNHLAEKFGIRPLSQLAQAHALCDGLVTLPRDKHREAKCLQRLAVALTLLTPNIHINDHFGLLLDVEASRALYRGYYNLLHHAVEIVAARQLRAHIVIAPTARGARWLARAHRQLVVERNIEAWLDDLPIHCMDIDATLLQALQQLNLPFVSSLRQLTATELNVRFGTGLTLALGQAYGSITESLAYWTPPPVFHQHVELIEPVNSEQHWWPGVTVLLLQLCEFMRLRSQSATALHFTFSNGAQQRTPVHVGAAQGLHQSEGWLRLLRAAIERNPLAHEVSRIDLQCHQFKPVEVFEQDFFDHRKAQQHIWQSLLDLLISRLGPQSLVLKPRQPQHALPESRCGSSVTDSRSASSVTDETAPCPSPRPLWLVDPPRRLNDSTLRRIQQALAMRYPERVAMADCDTPENHHQPAPLRDYYVVAAGHHRYWWVFRDRNNNSWFLQGIFA